MVRSVLITRAGIDAKEIANDIGQKNFKVCCEPFIEIIYHKQSLHLSIDQYAGLIFTSRNGVRAFCQNTSDRNVPVLTVGDQTLAEVHSAGFKQAQSASGDIENLIALLSTEKAEKPYLYCRGEHVSRSLKEAVTNVRIEELVLYHTEKQQKIHSAVVGNIKAGGFSDILFFSKRTAESFVDFVLNHPERDALSEGLKSSKALCLGASMVEYVSILPWQEVKIASHPDRDGVLALLDD